MHTHPLRLTHPSSVTSSYLGRSTGPGALALWTHHLTNLTLHPTWSSSSPSSPRAPPYTGPAIHLGAGIQGAALTAFAAAHSLAVVTGDCPSVGVAGGYLQGGGHSRLASRFGLAADQALAFEIIDADTTAGAHDGVEPRTVDATHEPELFWALRGGGAGAVVVLGVTVRAYADAGAARARLVFNGSSSAGTGEEEEQRKAPTMPGRREGSGATTAGAAFPEAVMAFQAHLPVLLDAGCAGQYTFRRGRFEMPLLVCYGLATAELRRLLAPLEESLGRLVGTYELRVDAVARYSDAARGVLDEEDYSVGGMQPGTWLVPRGVVVSPVGNRALIDAVLEIEDRGGLVGLQAFSPTREVAADADDAVFPGWRDAVLLVWVIL